MPFLEQWVIYDQLNWSIPNQANRRLWNNSGNGVNGNQVNTTHQANSTNYNQYAEGGRSFPRVDVNLAGVPFQNALNGILQVGTTAAENNSLQAQSRIQMLSGVFSADGYATRFQEVTDGLSNTIFVGEILPECSGAFQVGWWPLAGIRLSTDGGGSPPVPVYTLGAPLPSTIIPINTFVTCPRIQTRQKTTAPFGGTQCVDNIYGAASFGFKSRHPFGTRYANLASVILARKEGELCAADRY